MCYNFIECEICYLYSAEIVCGCVCWTVVPVWWLDLQSSLCWDSWLMSRVFLLQKWLNQVKQGFFFLDPLLQSITKLTCTVTNSNLTYFILQLHLQWSNCNCILHTKQKSLQNTLLSKIKPVVSYPLACE